MEDRTHTNIQAIETRLSRLEQKNRRQRMLLALIPVIAFSLGATTGDALKGKSVMTEKLLIVDQEGKSRAALFANQQGDPNLEFYNPDGSLLMNIARSDDNGIGCIQFFNRNGAFKGGAGGNALE